MHSQANARAGKVLRPPIRALPSVIVVTEKVMREADGPVGRAALTAHFGWKGDRPGVRLESRSGEPVRSPKNTSWNFQKADTQFSVLRVPCPKERSKAKVVENYQYTFALIRERLKLFFAQLFLLISTALTEQSQTCVKNAKPAMLEQETCFGWTIRPIVCANKCDENTYTFDR